MREGIARLREMARGESPTPAAPVQRAANASREALTVA